MRAWHWLMRGALVLFVVAAIALIGLAVWDRSKTPVLPLAELAKREDVVTITRDRWGVPTVRGRSDADVAFGVALAHAQDDFLSIQETLLATRSRLGSVEGPRGAQLDYLAHLLDVRGTVARGYDTLDPATRTLAEAYADGLNLYAARNPDAVLRGDLFPVRGSDVVANFVLVSPLFFGLDRTVGALYAGDPLPPDASVATTDRPRGSNAFALAPSRSADGGTHLVLNSHQPWEGTVAWYEVRVESDEGLWFAGALFPGSPVPLNGHNRDLGWANTINRPDLIDVYRLETDESGERYRLDGEWRAFERRRVWLRVRFGPFIVPVPRMIERSVHGPVLRNDGGTFAVRYAGMDEVRHLTQYHRLAKAGSLNEWLDAMNMRAVPATSFVYADRVGNIAMFYNAAFPERAAGFDWRGVLPGDTSEAIWTELAPFEAQPLLVNPPSGFIVAANNTPFLAAGEGSELDRADFDERLGIERQATNRIARALHLLEADPFINEAELELIKYDTGYERDTTLGRQIEAVMDLQTDDPALREARDLLRTWDWNQEGQGAADALAALVIAPINRAAYRGLSEPEPAQVLRDAMEHLREHYGRLDVPLGDLLRLRRGTIDLPLTGSPDALRAIGWEPDSDGRLAADFGDSFLMFVRWNRDGVVSSSSVQPFGQSSDPTSPHYADQAELFADQRTKPVIGH